MSYDIVCVGEAMLRFWVPPGERLENMSAFHVSVAGAEANVAMAAARMGRSSAWLSRLPDSALGHRALHEIAAYGVDVSHVRLVDDARMGTYYVELSVPPRPIQVIYDRAHSAATLMTSADIPWDVVEQAGVVHVAGITPALSPSCRELALNVLRRASTAAVDVNYRANLWAPGEARAVLTEMCRAADLVILTREDARDVFGLDGSPTQVVDAMQTLTGAESIVLTAGAEGAMWLTEDGEGSAPAYEAQVVDRIGAGDAFAAGVLMGYLDGDLPGGVGRGLAMAALKLGMFGDQLRCDPAEVDRVIAGGHREVSR